METRTRSRRSVGSYSTVSRSAQDLTDANTNYNQGGSSTPGRVPLPGLTGAVDTPLETKGLKQLRQKIEEELSKDSATRTGMDVSPGLANLRNTPGRGLKERQRELINKHEQIRQNSDKLNVGGGVTLWPNMNQMRLSRGEIITLIFTCFILMALTGWLFVFLHGATFRRMQQLTEHLNSFSESHPVMNTHLYQKMKSSVMAWHSDFRKLMEGVDLSLNVKRPSAGYQLYIALYLAGFAVLVYFLVDNMVSKSKLSPGRIKKWVCLLVVIGQWTIMLCVMFVTAHKVEAAIVTNVYWISEKLGEFVEGDLDLTTLMGVIQYWRWRCLPPASPGVVHILGLVAVQDVAVYLQYYSLPVFTVLLTPVVRLCLALRTIYKPSS